MNPSSPRWLRALRLSVVKKFVLPAAALLAFGGVDGSRSLLAQSGSSNSSGQMKWVASWSASSVRAATFANSNTFSAFNPQQDLRFPFPNLDTEGAENMSFRNIVKPDLWGNTMRFRFSNVFGTKPVTLGPVRVGLQEIAGVVLEGTNTLVTFNGGNRSVTIPAGQEVWSDAVTLSWVTDPDDILLDGRNLAVSFAVQGSSGPMTNHAVAFQANYLSAPNAGDRTNEYLDFSYPFTTTSWFFLNAVDVMAPADTQVVCVFGDSITDGTFSSLSTNDRWMNFLSRRLHEVYGNRVSIVNQGISGNTVSNPARTGQAAVDRLDRDVLGLSGLSSVIWLEGINDMGGGQGQPSLVISGYQNVVQRLHNAGVRVIGATILSSFKPDQNYATSPLGTTNGPLYGSPATFAKVQTVNDYIRNSGLFDGVADFYSATLNPATGGFRPEYSVSSTDLSSVDFLHPNRAGLLAMANSVNLNLVAPRANFFNGERPLGANGVAYLSFPNGRAFGFYAHLSEASGFIFHFDFGFAYLVDAGNGNAFLYDFASQGWFYTGTGLWPFVYDFNLGAWLRYEADPNRPGRYTSGPRRFFNFATNAVITK